MKHLRTLLTGALLCSGAAAVWAQATLSAEDKLAAIRRSLVEAALEGPTKVTSTQWIDANGALRESSSFKNGMELRGVKVIGYSSDAAGEPSAKLQWQSATPAKDGGASTSCKAPAASRLSHLIGWQWNNASRLGADDLALLHDLRDKWQTQWDAFSALTPLWRLVPYKRPAAGDAYEQALLGSPVDELPWHLELSVVPRPLSDPNTDSMLGSAPSRDYPAKEPAPAPEGARPQRNGFRSPWAGPLPPDVELELRLTLTSRKPGKALLQLSAPLYLQAQTNSWGPLQLNEESRARVLQQAENWALEMYKALACVPVMAEVTQTTANAVRVNVGSLAGVKVGDDWLLADPAKVPQRMLEPGVNGQTVMAKVQYVNTHYAQLKVVAGPAQSIQRNWAAWFAEDAR